MEQTTQTNGFGAIADLPQIPVIIENEPAAADALLWRRTALEDALRCAGSDGTPEYSILASLAHSLPGHTVRVFSESRARTLDALRRFLPDLSPLLTPAYNSGAMSGSEGQAVTYPIFGWWQGTAEDGELYEIVLCPYLHGGDGDWVIAGPNTQKTLVLADRIVNDATANTTRCLRYAGGAWVDAPEMQDEVNRTSWDDIVLAPALIKDIRETIDAFWAQKETFHKLGFAWRRGVLLVGPPGTGKTMVCKAVARAYPNVPFLYVRDLRTPARGEALENMFARARRLAPCILAIEDMDGLIHKDNRTTFLNELDGFKNNEGILLIASSNHPERIDEALLKRPSRFDRVYHIGLPEKSERAEYLRRLLEKSPIPLVGVEASVLAADLARETDGFTPAFLKEAFLSALITAAQENRETLNADFGGQILSQVEALRKYLKSVKNPEALADMLPSSGEGIGFRAR